MSDSCLRLRRPPRLVRVLCLRCAPLRDVATLHRGVAALALRQEHLEEALNFLKADGSGSKKRKREEEARTVIQLWKTSHQAKSFQKLKWVQLKIVH